MTYRSLKESKFSDSIRSKYNLKANISFVLKKKEGKKND